MTGPPGKEQATLTDYITGRTIPHVGAEANRQAVEVFLVETLGFAKSEIEVDRPLEFKLKGKTYRSTADLAVIIDGKYMIVIKCAAGSLGSREREVLAAARLLVEYQVPLAVVSDGHTALVFDAVTGKKRGQALAAIPSRQELIDYTRKMTLVPLPSDRREREQLIFRSYDSMNVNVSRPQ